MLGSENVREEPTSATTSPSVLVQPRGGRRTTEVGAIPKARQVLAGIRKGGWIEIGCEGSHHRLKKGQLRGTFSYHDNLELGTVQLKLVAKQFGFTLAELKKLI